MKLSTNFQLNIDAFLTWINEYSSLMDINLNIYDKEVQLFILLISLNFIIILSLIPKLRLYFCLRYGVTTEQYREMFRFKRETLNGMLINKNRDLDLIYYKLCYQCAYNKVMCASKPESRIPLYSRLWERGAQLNSSEKWRIYSALRNNQALAEIGYTLPHKEIKGLNGEAAYSSPVLIATLYTYENLGKTQ